MNGVGTAMLLGWVGITVMLFALLSPRAAALASILGGALLLPMGMIPLPAVPDLDKSASVALGLLLAWALVGWRSPPLRWIPTDYLMALWCVGAFWTSMDNDLGPYDGLSSTLSQVTTYAVPYWIGRRCFADTLGVQQIAWAVVLAAVLSILPALFEMKMSPVLHLWFYGQHQHAIDQMKRWGGWRPMLFMQHGLAVSMLMATAALYAGTFALAGSKLRWLGMRATWVAAALLVMTVLCKSAFTLVLLMVGCAALALVIKMRARWVVPVMVVGPLLYVALRATDAWHPTPLVQLIEAYAPERAQSLQVRLTSETYLVQKALERPWTGWGGWDRANIKDEFGGNWIELKDGSRYRAIPDGFWVVVLGKRGLPGLLLIFLIPILPPIVLAWRLPLDAYARTELWPVLATSIVLLLHTWDNLLNAMHNPMFMLLAGAMAGLVWAQPVRIAVRRAVPNAQEDAPATRVLAGVLRS